MRLTRTIRGVGHRGSGTDGHSLGEQPAEQCLGHACARVHAFKGAQPHDLGTCHPQRPPLSPSGLHHPTPRTPALSPWAPSQAGTPHSNVSPLSSPGRAELPGAREAAGIPRPAQPRLPGHQRCFPAPGRKQRWKSEAGGTGEETDLPLLSHSAGP